MTQVADRPRTKRNTKSQPQAAQPVAERDVFRMAVPQADLPPDPLRLRLDFHEDAVVLHDFGRQSVESRVVSAMDVAHALARELSMTSGLLPPETLWWANTAAGPVYAIWEAPKVRKVALQEKALEPPTRLAIPFPGLIFLCLPGQTPWVYAAKRRPRAVKDRVYKMPAFNVFESGRVCPGSHTFPMDAGAIPDSFFRSFFSSAGDWRDRSRKHPKDLKALWTELNGQASYPLKDLVPHGTVEDLLAITALMGRQQ